LNELKVGFLTLLALGSLLIVSIKITGNKSGFGDYAEYRTILNDASGIFEDSSIKVAGIVAGKIKSIDLSGSQALVKFEILKEIKITKFSQLRIKTVGFLGDKYLDVYLGNPEAPRLKDGAMILAQTGAGFEELGKDASDILKDVKEITRALRESLYDENQKNIAKEFMKNINEFSKNANDISLTLKRLIDGNEGKLNDTIENLKAVTSQLAFETDRYQDGSFMNDMEQIKPIMANVDKAVADLRDIVADVKSGKGTLGQLLRDEDVIDQVKETLSGVNKIVGRVNNYKTDISIYNGVNSVHGAKTDFELDLIPSPERFFRLGVSISDFGPITDTETTTTTTVDGGTPSVTNERAVDDSAYKFNLQIGRRINHFVMRAGIFESTGGVGFDYLMPDFGLKATLDLYDYQDDAGLNVRLGAEYNVWNVFYTKVTADDMNSDTNGQTYTISAGLKFGDEDLASLVGLLVN